MKSPTPARAAIVPHPQGGYTRAVPVGGDSTVRIYRGWWPAKPLNLQPKATR